MKIDFKSIVKKTLLLILGITLLTNVDLTANAATKSIQLGDTEALNGYVAGTYFNIKKTTSGKYLYCLNIHKNTARNIKATLVGQKNAGIAAIIANGYPHKSFTGNREKDYYITQAAIWWYLDSTTGSSNLGSAFKTNGSDPNGLRTYIKKLVNIGKEAKKNGYTKTTLKLAATDTTLTLSNGYYVSKSIKASQISNMKNYTVTLENAPSGSKILNSAGKETNKIAATDSFTIKIPASNIKATDLKVKVVAKGTATVSKAYEYQPTDKSMQNVVPANLETETVTKEDSIQLELTTTKVTIVKVDKTTKKALAGAKLVLKDAKGTVVTSWTSTVNGHVIKNLVNGTYTVEETSAPTGYKLNDQAVSFTITDSSKDVKVTFENEAKEVVVNIVKVDQSTGEPLAGAVLIVRDSQGQEIAKFTTTTDPYILTDLANGTYTVEEESAPAGYKPSSEKISFTIDDEHLTHQITFENYPEVIVPDTSSNSIILSLLGIGIIGIGIRFVYKNGKKA